MPRVPPSKGRCLRGVTLVASSHPTKFLVTRGYAARRPRPTSTHSAVFIIAPMKTTAIAATV